LGRKRCTRNSRNWKWLEGQDQADLKVRLYEPDVEADLQVGLITTSACRQAAAGP
jgi:hypothetical protein